MENSLHREGKTFLSDLGRFVKGRGITRADLVDTGTPCLRYGDIYTTYGDVTDELTSCVSADTAQRATPLHHGDIIFATSGETAEEIGKAVAWLGKGTAVAGSDTIILRDHGQDPVFLAHALNAHDAAKQKSRLGKGHSVVHIHEAEFAKVQVLLPSIPEQHKIAGILRTWDKAIEKLEMLLAAKKQIRNQLLSDLLENPRWSLVSLYALGQISSAGVDKKIIEGEAPVRLVNFLDVFQRDFLYDVDFKHSVTAPTRQIQLRNVLKGDVFFTPSSETQEDLAYSAVAMEDMPGVVYSYHVVRLRFVKKIDLLFRAYLFKSQHFRKQAFQLCTGSGQRYVLSQNHFMKMTVHVPPIEDQRIIGSYFWEVDQEISLISKKIEALNSQKSGLLQKLLSGEWRVTLSSPA